MNKNYPPLTRYKPQNPKKYIGNINTITMRSSWETIFARWCDFNPNVLKWGSEIKPIRYYSKIDREFKNYFADFWVLIKDKDDNENKYIVEIKPKNKINKPKNTKNRNRFLIEMCEWQKNQDKWEAALDFAKRNGFKFIVLNEYDLGIAK